MNERLSEPYREYMQSKIENEGFEYAFVGYSDFKDINDVKFHELREKYLQARIDLIKYLELGNGYC